LFIAINTDTFMQFKAFNPNADPNLISRLFPATPTTGPVVPGPEGIYVTLDQWDGLQAERDEIIEEIGTRNVKNFVTIIGDIHTFIAGYIRQNFDDATSQPQGPSEPGINPPPPPDAVGVEFVCGSVTSSNLTEIATFGRGRSSISADREDVSEALQETNNRHFRCLNSDTHGYNLIEATPEKLTCTMKSVSTIKAPTATEYAQGVRGPGPEY
jgi:alkaline phosphatase D